MSGDVDFELSTGEFFVACYALMTQAHVRRYGTREEQMARLADGLAVRVTWADELVAHPMELLRFEPETQSE